MPDEPKGRKEAKGQKGEGLTRFVKCYWCQCLTANLGKVCTGCLLRSGNTSYGTINGKQITEDHARIGAGDRIIEEPM